MTENTGNHRIDDSIRSLLDHWFDVDVSDEAALNERYRRWFKSSPEEDRLLAERFGDLMAKAADGLLDDNAKHPHGRLGLILALDQLPRNLCRGQAAAFAHDARALKLCLDGMESGADRMLAPLERVFFYMPLQHAESVELQELSVTTFRALAGTDAEPPVADKLRGALEFAELHRDIVVRFGRFPHRNRILGRESTPEEQQYLSSDGPSFGQ